MPQLRPNWFARWRREYGLSLRKPNRKYKVSKRLLASRFETMILNVARVRAAAEELLGYDPHILNWDQSPFHHNESGTACTKTLAVKGSTVPLVEGHDDSKARWTANLCVSSDTQALLQNGPPPAEFMFRGGGQHQGRPGGPLGAERIRRMGVGGDLGEGLLQTA